MSESIEAANIDNQKNTLKNKHLRECYELYHVCERAFVIVFLAYAILEMIPINYRPILIEGRMEIGFRSTLVHGYRRWCPVKCQIV